MFNVCINCGSNGAELHHVVPLSVGGNDIDSNKVLLCSKCHTLVHGTNPERRGTHWKELQRAGIEKAKREGKYRGRKPMFETRQKFVELIPLNISGERTARSICKEIGISPNSFYRWKLKWERGELFNDEY